MRKSWFILLLGIVGIIALANAARYTLGQQSTLRTDHIVFDKDYTLSATVEDDLVTVAEIITLDENSHVTGNVALIGDQMTVNGRIDGDLTVMGDRIQLGPGAAVSGNITLLVDQAAIDGTIAGSLNAHSDLLTIHADARIAGDVFACADSPDDLRVDAPAIRHCNESDFFSSTETLAALSDPSIVIPLINIAVGGGAVFLLFSALGSLSLAGLSVLAVVMFPRQISHIEEAIRLNPRGLGGTGLVLIVLVAGLSVALGAVVAIAPLLSVVAIPLFMVMAVLFFGMVLTGWITITLITGNLIVGYFKGVSLPPLVIAAVGNVSLLLAWNLLALNTYSRIGAVIALCVLGAVGLGAAFTTRMGTRPAHRSYLVQG